jgi:glutamyl-tRNA synthetase
VTSRPEFRDRQARDLVAIGIDWDGEPLVQSERFDAHHEAIEKLVRDGHTFECFCTRREMAEAAQAPNGLDAATHRYPGTCRRLTSAQRAKLHQAGRRPALRLLSDNATRTVNDRLLGPSVHVVDDVVLRRNDGVPAYNLAVVVDDAFQGIDEVVRADDLLSSTPAQMLIAELLGLATCSYVHVPLVVNDQGVRLAKRDGAITLTQLEREGLTASQVREVLDRSLRPAQTAIASIEPGEFRLNELPLQPWTFTSAYALR